MKFGPTMISVENLPPTPTKDEGEAISETSIIGFGKVRKSGINLTMTGGTPGAGISAGGAGGAAEEGPSAGGEEGVDGPEGDDPSGIPVEEAGVGSSPVQAAMR